MPLLPDEFTPSGAGIEIHEAQHEPRHPETQLVEPHRGPQRLRRRSHQPLGVELALRHPDTAARIRRDHPGAQRGVEDGGEQRAKYEDTDDSA